MKIYSYPNILRELERIVSQIREHWSKTPAIIRGDSGLCRGDITARAVALFHDLNTELEKASGGSLDMMDLTKNMIDQNREFTLSGIRALAEEMLGVASPSLQRELANHGQELSRVAYLRKTSSEPDCEIRIPA